MRDMADPATARTPPVWCIVANVVAERPYGPGGLHWRRGLRLFPAGAKVQVPGGYPGMGYDTVTVIGRTRHSARYAVVDIRTAHLTNWRVKLVYSPAVLDRLGEVCPTPNRGFSPRGSDRTSQAYREDLQRAATQFQQHTDAVHQQWQRHRAGAASTARGGIPAVVARGRAWLRQALHHRPPGR